jgi:VCBS repeat-containing protein
MKNSKFISRQLKLLGIGIVVVAATLSMTLQAVDTTTIDSNATEDNTTVVAVEQIDTLSVLYFAMFNRMPDSIGLEYWRNKINSEGWSIESVAQSFFDQNETKALYPDLYINNPDRVNLITSVYQNLFNRYPDGEGLEYWDREMLLGAITPSLFILAIINGAGDSDKKFIISMLKVTEEFTKNSIVDQEKFRDILSILFEDGESTAMDYIIYLSHESDISYLKPTISFKEIPTIPSGATVNISTLGGSSTGLDIAMYDESIKRWKTIGQKVPAVGEVIELFLSDIRDGMEIKIRFQNTQESIVSGESVLKIVIKKAVANLADSDGDGVLDRGDLYPNDPKESRDSDGDGIGDNADKCDNTPKGAEIAEDGCSPNTPAVLSGELSGVITEGEPPLSRSITVTDPDEGEAVMIADNISGSYGEFSISTDGGWTYIMTADLAKSVSQNDNFIVSSKDGVAGNIRVTVIGADVNETNTNTTN